MLWLFWAPGRFLRDPESLPVRVVEVLSEGVKGGDLGQAGELATQEALDGREADQDAGARIDGIGEGLQIALDEGRGIGEAGLFAYGGHALLHKFMVALLFCLHFECLWMAFDCGGRGPARDLYLPNYSLCSKKT